MSRRVLAVIACMMVGTAVGGVVHARNASSTTVRTCEETEDGSTMYCDDGTTCYLVNGVWICEPNSPEQL